jgi:hypothetical protein
MLLQKCSEEINYRKKSINDHCGLSEGNKLKLWWQSLSVSFEKARYSKLISVISRVVLSVKLQSLCESL